MGRPLIAPSQNAVRAIRPGDVGFLREGVFHPLFNATHAATDPVNSLGVPRGFKVLRVDEERFRYTKPALLHPGPICTKSVTHLITTQ